MTAVLPPLTLVVLILVMAATNPWRLAILKAATLWGVLLVGATEGLSLINGLRPAPVAVFWALSAVGAGAACGPRRAAIAARLRGTRPAWLPALAMVPVAVICACLLLVAVAAPPNTWDSMTFHLSRVVHWIAGASVAPYSTNDTRQLFEPPWSEYAVLNLQVLARSDRLANLVQWASMLGSLAGVALLAERLGAPPRGQLLAVTLTATLPMGIMQATSTQTDYVVAFWCVCTVAFALDLVAVPGPRKAAWLAAALGLAMLTKGTAYLVLAPLVLLTGGFLLARVRPARSLAAVLLLLVAIPLALNGPFFARNLELFQNPLGPRAEESRLASQLFTPSAIVSTALRDAVLQFGSPYPEQNAWLSARIVGLHRRVLGIDVSDPRTTWPGTVFQVNQMALDEDYAGDPLQSALALLAGLAALLFTIWRDRRLVPIYAAGLLAGYLFFAAYLRWHPWNARLELPMLVLAAPLTAAVIARFSNAAVAAVLGAVLVVASIPWVIDNDIRPLVGFPTPGVARLLPRYLPTGQTVFNIPRADLYFEKQPDLKPVYVYAARRAQQLGCHRVGFLAREGDWEYPLWALIQPSDPTVRVEWLTERGPVAASSPSGAAPCLVVDALPDKAPTVTVDGVPFVRSEHGTRVGVYERG